MSVFRSAYVYVRNTLPTDVMDTLISDLDVMELELIDFNQSLPDMNIDDETDWFDFLHFNLNGALKFSSFLAQYLVEQGFAPSEAAQSELWQIRLSALNKA